MVASLLPDGVRVLVLGSGRIGNEINARGVAQLLVGRVEWLQIQPRPLYGFLSPWGPLDPRERGRLLKAPLPDIVIACGRKTVPYIRALKKAGGERLFAVFMQDPRHARNEMDLIWVPEHDAYRGANVIASLTSPHPFSAARLAAARAKPDPRVAALPAPRCAVLLGGSSGTQHFTPDDLTSMREATQAIVDQGYSVMATPSRRTPAELTAAVREGLGDGAGFVWDGDGENPYASLLALADAILVTGDSANMVGEAVATGAPVHIFEPSGGHSRKLGASIEELISRGVARRFEGGLEPFEYQPIDCSAMIAGEIAARFLKSRAGGG